MPDPVLAIDYHLGTPPITNPDGSVPATATGCTPVPGPGASVFGSLASALRFTGGAHLAGVPSAPLFDPRRFCIRMMLRATAPVTGRVNVYESSLPACSILLEPSTGRGQFRVQGWVHNARNGWASIDSANALDLQLDEWFALEFVCDLDTLGLFVNGNLIALTAFPDGTPVPSTTAAFTVGVFTDLTRFAFTGEIALLQVWNGIPVPLEQALDDARGNPEWQIRLKENTLLPAFPLGARVGDITYDAGTRMWLQRFVGATIGYATGLPGAYVMYGAIRARWESARGLAKRLGPLVADEGAGRAEGTRRSVFEQGAIYWSGGTGAWEILGRPYIDYEQMGGSISVLRLPIGAAETIPGGTMQRFQGGRLYYRTDATRAYELHGAILNSFLISGGTGTWGFPVSDEEDVRLAPSTVLLPPATGARQSRFEWDRALFLWSTATGVHSVHGAIRDAYLQAGGPGVPNDNQYNGLGLPITDETDLPAWAGFGRFNAFQNGSVVWKGGVAQVCPAFRIKLGLVQTEEDEGWGQGENDLQFRINLSQNGTTVFFTSLSFDDDNTRDLDLLIDHLVVPNDPELRLELSVEVWDEDDTSGDDHLGTLTKELNIANAWGLFDNNQGQFVATNLGKVKRFEWQVQPRQPPDAPKDFWNTGNPSTATLIYDQYAAAFTDIDDDPEWTDPSDWAQREVFARRVKRIASGGNCFGFCTEALYAWNGHGLGLPLSRFQSGDWETIRNTINIKQIYWIGSDVVAHTEDQEEDNISPRAVFLETRDRYAGGDPCVVCMFDSNSGHCVVPFAWDDTGPLWTMTCFDPNGRNVPTQIVVDSNRDTFSFSNAGRSYSGYLRFAPWSALNHRQSSPAWDPNMLLLGLLMVVVGADSSTTGITDSLNDNLWMRDNTTREPRSGVGQFASLAAMDGSLDGEILVRRVRPELDFTSRTSDTLDKTVLELASLRREPQAGEPGACDGHEVSPLPPRLARALAYATLSPEMKNLPLRDLLHGIGLASDSAQLSPEVRAVGNWLRRQSSSRGPDFKHQLRGTRRGLFEHLTRWRLTATWLRSAISRGELHTLEAGGLSGRMPLYKLTTERDKVVSLEHTVRLGRSASFARISLGNLPARAGLSLNVSVRSGLAAVDVLTGGQRVDVPVLVETWHGAARREQRFVATIDGGMRLTPALHESGAAMKQAPIETMFGEAGRATLLKPTGP